MNQDNESTSDDRLNQILAEYLQAVEAGQPPDEEKLLAQYPEFVDQLREFFADKRRVDQIAKPGAEQDQVPLETIPLTKGVHEAATLPPGDDLQSAIHNPQSAIGTVRYFGDYELLEEIARGGMGVVYKARQVKLNRVVAIKMILAGQLASQEDVQRFHTEAEAAANLDHPGIVPIFEVGEHEGQHYFSMGFVDGESLASKLVDKPLAPKEAAEVVRSVAEAVQYAHDKGVIHRDLKPANILLDKDGQPKVSDFGLAKKTEADSGLTGTGQILGTPSYMPWEQAAGKNDQIGPLSDVYSLGAILYCLLTGRPPFESANPLDTLMQVLEAEPICPRQLNASVPRDLETICLKCLQKKPHKRFASAASLVSDLDRFLAGEPIHARPVSRWERAVKWAKRRPVVAAMSAAIVLLILVGFSLVTWQWQRAESHLYTHRVALAQREWSDNNVARADELLNECPRGRRSWEWHYLKRLCHPELMTLLGHTDWVRSVAFAPDGKRLATAGFDGTARVWDVDSGRELLNIRAPSKTLNSIVFSPDGRFVATAGGDYDVRSGVIAIWNAQTGKQVQNLSGFREPVDDVAFSPDGKRLAAPVSAEKSRVVRVWDVVSGQELLDIHSGLTNAVAFSPDGQQLATNYTTLNVFGVKLWDATSGVQLLALPNTEHSVWQLAFSPDGQQLAAAVGNSLKPGEVKVWDVTSGQEVRTLRGHPDMVYGVVFSPDGRYIASASADQTVKVWDSVTGDEIATLRGHTDMVTSLAFSPDGQRVASAGRDRTVKFWDMNRLSLLRDKPQEQFFRGHTSGVTAVAFSSTGRLVATAETRGSVTIWDKTTGKALRTLSGPSGPAWGLAFSADDRYLAAAVELGQSRSSKIRIWDAATGQVIQTISVNEQSVRAVAFSPNNKRLAVAGTFPVEQGFTGGATLVDVASGRQLLRIRASRTGMFYGVAFSPDGKRLAMSGPKNVEIHSATSGRVLNLLRGHRGQVKGVAFSADGTRVASVDDEGAVKIWNSDSGQELLTLLEEAGVVTRETFTVTGRARGSMPADVTHRSNLAFIADGTHLAISNMSLGMAAGDVKGEIKVWDATPLPASHRSLARKGLLSSKYIQMLFVLGLIGLIMLGLAAIAVGFALAIYDRRRGGLQRPSSRWLMISGLMLICLGSLGMSRWMWLWLLIGAAIGHLTVILGRRRPRVSAKE